MLVAANGDTTLPLFSLFSTCRPVMCVHVCCVQVHGGFWNAFASIRAELQEELINALRAAGVGARLFATGNCRMMNDTT